MKKFTAELKKWGKKGAAALLAVSMAFAVPGTGMAQETQAEPYNLLLIGSDRRDDSWNGNSDVVILLTVNEESQKLLLTSFMRDLYAEIPGYGVHKLNYAYAAGGAETLRDTLETNYELEIDNYAAVDFETMAKVVDLVGGVDMTVSEEECGVLNDYLISMGQEEDQLFGGGDYRLDGYQAVAYMRIRYVGDNDYERTHRQRMVLEEIFDSMGDLDATQLTKLAEDIFPEIENDIDPVRFLKLMTDLPEYMEYELEDQRIPYDGLYTSQSEMLVPDFAATIEKLHAAMGIE